MTPFITLLAEFLPVVQIVLSLLIVGAVLLQTRGAGLSAFQDSANQTYYKRRGGELFLFRSTLVLAVLFVLASLFTFVVQ
jgi:protein translocase SecG subunit